MTPAEFRLAIGQSTDRQLLDVCLRNDQIPFVFDSKLSAWDAFRDTLNNGLDVGRGDISVVGSGRFGFSLTPGRDLGKFRDSSDIDVVIVNDVLFDQLWLALLGAAYPRFPLTRELGPWFTERKSEVYTGYLTPLEVKLDIRIVGTRGKSVLEFTSRWFNAFKEAGRHPIRRHSDVKGRIYRTWQLAELYHLHSLRALRKTLIK
jgi:hypothetical protein